MQNIIYDLLNSYEKRALTRRQLVQALATLAGASAAAVPASAQSDPTANAPMTAMTLDHLSIQVKDLDRSVHFYQSVFGLPFINRDEKTKTVRLKVGANSRLAIRIAEPYGVYDHVGFGIPNLNKATVTEKLKAQGVQTLETGEPLQYHVVDPDGNPIQIISLDNRK